MIIALCLLGSLVVFLLVALLALYTQVIRPMCEQVEQLKLGQEPISKRTEEINLDAKIRHLDVREDVVRLARRVVEVETKVVDLEDSFCARSTVDMGKPSEATS